jgi:hypothetical protein
MQWGLALLLHAGWGTTAQSPTTCALASVGYYAPGGVFGSTPISPCNANTMTATSGSTSMWDCNFALPGYAVYTNDTAQGPYAVECTTGYSVGGINATCAPCPVYTVVNSTGATSSAFCKDLTGFVNPAMNVTIQECAWEDPSCQGWAASNPLNIYSVPVTPTTIIQDWMLVVPYWKNPNSFGLRSTRTDHCVDVCLTPNCGSDHGNIIWYYCHYETNQQWHWWGDPDANGGRMIYSGHNGQCITSCPQVNLNCNFITDVSTTACDPNDPYQRWVFGSLADIVG